MIPISLDITNTIWYNKAIFEENGLTPPATWAEFVALVDDAGRGGRNADRRRQQRILAARQLGLAHRRRVVPPDEYAAAFGRTAKFSTPGFEKALDLMRNCRWRAAFNRDMQGLGADPAMATFFQEAAAMHPIGSWLIAEAGNRPTRISRYAPVRHAADRRRASVDGQRDRHDHRLHGAQATAPHPDAAIKFLKFFTSKPAAKIWTEVGQHQPGQGADEGANAGRTDRRSIVDLLAGAGSIVPPPDTTYPVPLAEA